MIPVQRKLCPACGVSPEGTPQLLTGRLDWRTDPADELFSDLSVDVLAEHQLHRTTKAGFSPR